MDKYYHFTNYNCFYSIMNNGLIPQTGFRCKSIGDDSHGVFLSKGIDRSILMFSLMLSFYEKYNGYEGDKLIEKNLREIKDLKRWGKSIGNDEIIKHDIECYLSQIDRVNLIRSCGSFINYLGGYGCFLSVDDLKNIDDTFPENCCYCDVIPPSQINVVNVKNKYTNACINSMNVVLSHFMHLFPIEELLKIVPEENKNSIYRLYNFKDINYNPNYFDLVEIPITCYDYNCQSGIKIKMLTR